MVTIKEAVANAIQFAEDSLDPDRLENTRLEEVESETIDGRDYWRITLSMVDHRDSMNKLSVMTGLVQGRHYKTFSVLKDTGEVTRMRIREFAAN